MVKILSTNGKIVQCSIGHDDVRKHVPQFTPSSNDSQYVLLYTSENELWILEEVRARITHNYFSPAIYRNAVISSNTNLAVEDTYFDQQGNRREGWIEAVTDHVCAILSKRQITLLIHNRYYF